MEVRVGDYGYDIPFAIKQSDGETVEDLSSVQEIRFRVAEQDNYRNILNGLCTVDDQAGGLCHYTVVSGDFSKVGNFIGGIWIKYTSGKMVTSRDIFVTVKQSLNPV